MSEQAKISYKFIKCVYETKDMFYLYVTKNQAFLLRKSDITEGSVSDLQNILKENMPVNKYFSKGV